jgi:hypothetical protein
MKVNKRKSRQRRREGEKGSFLYKRNSNIVMIFRFVSLLLSKYQGKQLHESQPSPMSAIEARVRPVAHAERILELPNSSTNQGRISSPTLVRRGWGGRGP